ncbi:MAG TPA: hypothetical protein VM914_05340 [Pyrinomonadaceae bacterium]|nr:hypothetical protein [Pyrinomonadaceae bacterium]
MDLCEGNWSSAIRWETKGGAAVPDADKNKYEDDGKLHVCPYVGTNIRVTYINKNNLPGKMVEGTCDMAGGDRERFKLTYARTADDERVWQYEGYGRVLNGGAGPGFINGRVTVSAAGGPAGGVRAGVWEAIKLGDHGRALGTHEPPVGHTTDSSTKPGP